MVRRAEIVAVARGWLGTPWRHQGRTRRGVDCVGLVVLVLRELGLAVEDRVDYQRHSHGRDLLIPLRTQGVPKHLRQACPGDVLAFIDRVYPCHIGFLAERDGVPTVIHAAAQCRCVLEEPYAPALRQRARHAYGLPGVSD